MVTCPRLSRWTLDEVTRIFLLWEPEGNLTQGEEEKAMWPWDQRLALCVLGLWLKEARNPSFSPRVSGGGMALQTLWFWSSETNFRLLASRTMRINFSVLSHQICSNLLQLPQETNTVGNLCSRYLINETPTTFRLFNFVTWIMMENKACKQEDIEMSPNKNKRTTMQINWPEFKSAWFNLEYLNFWEKSFDDVSTHNWANFYFVLE